MKLHKCDRKAYIGNVYEKTIWQDLKISPKEKEIIQKLGLGRVQGEIIYDQLMDFICLLKRFKVMNKLRAVDVRVVTSAVCNVRFNHVRSSSTQLEGVRIVLMDERLKYMFQILACTNFGTGLEH